MCLYARTFLVALENYSGCLGELFWLPRGIVLVGQGSRIEAIQNLPDVRFLFLPPLLPMPISAEKSIKFGNIVQVETLRY